MIHNYYGGIAGKEGFPNGISAQKYSALAKCAKATATLAFDYFKANAIRISAETKVNDHDFHLHAVELQNTGPFTHLALASLAVFSSGLLGKPVQNQMVVMGDMSLGGSVTPVESIAGCF